MAKNKNITDQEPEQPEIMESEQQPVKELSLMEKRKVFLLARLAGPNVGEYPAETRAAWKRELALMAAGLWRGPVRIKSKSKMAEEIIG